MTMAPILLADSSVILTPRRARGGVRIWERNGSGEALASSVRRPELRQDSVADVGRHDGLRSCVRMTACG